MGQIAVPNSASLNTFANPPRDAYLLWHPFIMPTDKAGTRSIAVNSEIADHIVSAYSIIIFMICGFAWQFVVFLVLTLYPTDDSPKPKGKDANPCLTTQDSPESPDAGLSTSQLGEQNTSLEVRKRKANRYITLITIRNSNAPTFTMMMMLFEHTRHMCFRAKDPLTGTYDIVILIAALMVTAGSSVAGTLVPRHFVLGTVAPANPWQVYYGMPSVIAATISNQKTKSAAAQRAIGVVSSAGDQLLKRVNVYDPKVMDWTGPNGEIINQTAYDYNVTGLDFGLQLKHATEFVLRVTGACTLQYGWSNLSANNPIYEVYRPFNSSNSSDWIYLPKDESARPVGGMIVLPDATNGVDQQNRTCAIIPDTLGRWSISTGTDPWYNTSDTPVSTDPDMYAVALDRPALYCWQQDIWSYKGHSASNASGLESLPGLNLPDVIGGADGYISYRLINPMIYDVAGSLGASILVSSSASDSGNIDASQCKYSDDLKHLVLASFLVTQNILRDSVMVANTTGLQNNAINDITGLPELGAGKFVVSSSDVVTLSVNVLIGVPFIWLFLQLARMCFSVTKCTYRNSGVFSRYTLRSVGLQHVQMYRLLDEEVCGYRNDWHERKGQMPYIRDAQPIASTPAGTSARQHALYIAPKVVNFHNGFHLKFTGDVGRESKRKSIRGPGRFVWSWKGKENHPIFNRPIEENHPSVVNEPNNGERGWVWCVLDFVHKWMPMAPARTAPAPASSLQPNSEPEPEPEIQREVVYPLKCG